MNPEQLDLMAADAMARVAAWVARSAGQHSRAIFVAYLKACDRLNKGAL